jgi:hypothetical protein
MAGGMRWAVTILSRRDHSIALTATFSCSVAGSTSTGVQKWTMQDMMRMSVFLMKRLMQDEETQVLVRSITLPVLPTCKCRANLNGCLGCTRNANENSCLAPAHARLSLRSELGFSGQSACVRVRRRKGVFLEFWASACCAADQRRHYPREPEELPHDRRCAPPRGTLHAVHATLYLAPSGAHESDGRSSARPLHAPLTRSAAPAGSGRPLPSMHALSSLGLVHGQHCGFTFEDARMDGRINTRADSHSHTRAQCMDNQFVNNRYVCMVHGMYIVLYWYPHACLVRVRSRVRSE